MDAKLNQSKCQVGFPVFKTTYYRYFSKYLTHYFIFLLSSFIKSENYFFIRAIARSKPSLDAKLNQCKYQVGFPVFKTTYYRYFSKYLTQYFIFLSSLFTKSENYFVIQAIARSKPSLDAKLNPCKCQVGFPVYKTTYY